MHKPTSALVAGLVLAGVLSPGGWALAQTPLGTAFTYQGRLVDGGSPATGSYDFQLVLFDAPVGGSQVGPILVREDVVAAGGLFTLTLDFGASAFAGSARFVETAVRPGASTGVFTPLAPRQALTPAPGAIFGATAPWTGVLAKPAGFADDTDNDLLGALACTNGQVAKFSGTTWVCAADGDSGGDITAVTAGTGLSGGGTSGSVTVSANLAALQSRVSGTCVPGSAIRTVNQDGTVACETDDDTTFSAGAGLNLAGTVFSVADLGVTTPKMADNAVTTAKIADGTIALADLGANGCGAGQVMKSNGTAWACAADADSGGDVTAVTAGTGLTGGGTSGAVTLTVNPATVQSRVSGTCPAGSSIAAVNANGTVVCEPIPTPPVNWSLNGTPLTVASTSTAATSRAILATSAASSGTTIEAVAAGSGGTAVLGENASTTGSAVGVLGRVNTETGTAFVVSAFANGDNSGGANTNTLIGVRGDVFSQSAHGVQGRATGLRTTKSSVLAGVFGFVNSTNGYGVFSQGDMGTTGAKAFVNPHPTDPARAIQFFSLEGNESGTYFRGTAQLAGGKAEVAIPEEWGLVTADEGITVQLTPVGAPGVLYVLEKSRERIVIGGTADVRFDYLVNGVRRGFTSYDAYLTSDAFRPEQKGVPFGMQYPKALRDILVQNGMLNADYTPNEATAARLGWDLLDAEEAPKLGMPQPRKRAVPARGEDQ